MSLALVVEGDTDLPVARKLAADADLPVWTEIDSGGKGQLDAHYEGYNRAANGSPWLVIRDLDVDATCPGEFVGRLRRGSPPSPWMCFRLAVREIEAWLLADHVGAAGYFGFRESSVPANPDDEDDPTLTLLDLVRRAGKARLKGAMPRRPGGSAVVGPLYEATIIDFGTNHWDLGRAARRSPSLRRARQRLGRLAARWRRFAGSPP